MNELSFIKALQNISLADGPFLSLYLNTEAREETGAEQIQLRWRALREQIDGMAPERIEQIDQIVGRAHLHGDGLAVIATERDLLLRRYLRRAIPDSISYGPLPNLLPLIEWGQDNPRHIVMLMDRVGADVFVVNPDRDLEQETITGDKPDIGRTRRGGWSQPRFQRGATKAWRDNATLVAEELGKIREKEEIDIVLVAGDVEALRFLKENLPEDRSFLFSEIDGSRQVELDDLDEELDKTLAGFSGQAIESLLEKFAEERGQKDLATEGIDATLESLRMAQVDTLLIRAGGIEGTAVFSQETASQAARDRSQLTGVDDVTEGPLTDVLVSGAIASGAKVVAVPDLSERHGPKEGVSAILRYST
jgi:peptide subunit release factor 1 (eRF1)